MRINKYNKEILKKMDDIASEAYALLKEPYKEKQEEKTEETSKEES